MRRNKKKFFNDAIKEKKNPAYLWKGLKMITNDDDKCSNIPNTVFIENQVIEGKQNVADALNTHFVNIAKAINRVSWLDSNFTSLKSYTDIKLENKTFELKYVTTIDVENMIKQLDSNKSTGADAIGPNILKICKNYLIIPITAIINNCISKNVFPD